MTKDTLKNILTNDSKTFGNLLGKLKQFNQWNTWLKECLPHEQTLFEHCTIVGLDKKSLIVIADNSHWVTRFRFYIPLLLQHLRQYPELKDIQAICCKVRPQQYPSAPKQQGPKPTLSANSAESLRHAASEIKDPKLKEILERLASRSEE